MNSFKEFLIDLWDSTEGRWFIGTLVLLLLLISLLGTAAYLEHHEWEKFKVEHKCRPIRHISGSTSVGYSATANGNGGTIVTSSPERTIYHCNDGMEYER